MSPCSSPASSRARSTTGMPPIRSTSVITYRPKGLTSARCGVRSPIRLKSSRVSSTRASCAMASRCSTALVDPPSAITTAIAFSNASLVRIWRAVMPASSRRRTASPLRTAKPSRRRSTAGGGGRAGQGHAQRLGRGGHRVGGVHAGAGAFGGAGVPLDVVQLGPGDPADRARADALEGVQDREVPVPEPAGQDRPAVEEARRRGPAGPRPSACPAATCRSRPAAPCRPSARRAPSARPSRRSPRGETSDARMPSCPIEMPSETAIVVNSIG